MACSLSQSKTPQAPVAQWVIKQQSPSLCEHCLNNKNKKHCVLFCGTETQRSLGSHHWMWQKDMGHSVWRGHEQMNRVLYITVLCCSKCAYNVIWYWISSCFSTKRHLVDIYLNKTNNKTENNIRMDLLHRSDCRKSNMGAATPLADIILHILYGLII